MKNGMYAVGGRCSFQTVWRFAQQGQFILFVAFFVAAVTGPLAGVEASSLSDALSNGKVSLNMRYRYERVDQDGIGKNAHASTVRSRLGYQTGDFKGISGFLEFEDVSVVGNEQYNSTANGLTQYPVVADPEDTEVNQAYLQFTGLEGLTVRGGRQRIKVGNDRFIGNVGWRQNEQTFDAIALIFSPLEALTATYAYLDNVNRIFGEHHPTASSANTPTSTHVIHFAYTGMPVLKVSAYAPSCLILTRRPQPQPQIKRLVCV